jgi:hypothetical protein
VYYRAYKPQGTGRTGDFNQRQSRNSGKNREAIPPDICYTTGNVIVPQ